MDRKAAVRSRVHRAERTEPCPKSARPIADELPLGIRVLDRWRYGRMATPAALRVHFERVALAPAATTTGVTTGAPADARVGGGSPRLARTTIAQPQGGG